LSSTYIKWILVAIALAVGVWVVARPSGKNKSNPGGAPPGPTPEVPAADPPPTDPSPPPATVRSAPHPVPRPAPAPAPVSAPVETGNGHAGATGGEAQIASSLGLWGDGYADGVRDRWRELQLRFVDDPQSVAGEAERVVDEAVAALTASVNARKEELSTWRSGRGDDTEQLRAAVARYREFLDRLLRV
jgi:hypothetical protein